MRPIRPRVLVVVLLLLVAGCVAPTAQRGPDGGAVGSTAHDDPAERASDYDVETVGGDLPADPATVFARVEHLLATDATPPSEVVIEPNDRMTLSPAETDEFDRLLGMTYGEGSLVAAGYVDRPDRITINEAILDDEPLAESVLAHEAVHVVQYDEGGFDRVTTAFGDADVGIETTDGVLAYRATIEGTAVYAERAYWDRHLAEDAPGPAPDERLTAAHRDARGAFRLDYGVYRFGYEHVDARIEDPAQLGRIYERPPRTTAEVLHGREDDGPVLEPLRVEAASGAEWARFDPEDDRLGELYLRSALSEELDASRAAAVAAGWENDRLVAYDRDAARGYVWAIRTENATAAAALERGFEALLEERDGVADDSDSEIRRHDGEAAYRIVRTDAPNVVVIALGHPDFVGDVAVTVDADRGASDDAGAPTVDIEAP